MSACGVSGDQPDTKIDSLVTAEWLSQHLDDPNLVVLDCTVAFILTRLGFTDVAVYAASLQEWTADLSNPMEISSSQDLISK